MLCRAGLQGLEGLLRRLGVAHIVLPAAAADAGADENEDEEDEGDRVHKMWREKFGYTDFRWAIQSGTAQHSAAQPNTAPHSSAPPQSTYCC